MSFVRGENDNQYQRMSTLDFVCEQRGHMVAVNNSGDLSSQVEGFYQVFERPTPNKPQISLPFPDQATDSGRNLLKLIM